MTICRPTALMLMPGVLPSIACTSFSTSAASDLLAAPDCSSANTITLSP